MHCPDAVGQYSKVSQSLWSYTHCRRRRKKRACFNIFAEESSPAYQAVSSFIICRENVPEYIYISWQAKSLYSSYIYFVELFKDRTIFSAASTAAAVITPLRRGVSAAELFIVHPYSWHQAGEKPLEKYFLLLPMKLYLQSSVYELFLEIDLASQNPSTHHKVLFPCYVLIKN